jgi:hypothetical protein
MPPIFCCCSQSLPSNHACLRSRYSVTAVVYLLVSRSFPSNGFSCHNILFLTANFIRYLNTLIKYAYLHVFTESICHLQSNLWWQNYRSNAEDMAKYLELGYKIIFVKCGKVQAILWWKWGMAQETNPWVVPKAEKQIPFFSKPITIFKIGRNYLLVNRGVFCNMIIDEYLTQNELYSVTIPKSNTSS